MNQAVEDIKFLTQVPLEIRDKCMVRLQNTLNNIELNNLIITKRLTILCKLIDTAREYNAKKDIVNVILKHWDPIETDKIDPDGIIGDLSATFICSMENLKYLVSLYEYCTPLTVLDAHIRSRLDSGMVFSIVANRTLEAYETDNLHEVEWEQLVKATEDSQTLKSQRHTMEILTYIRDKLELNNKKVVAKKPEWVNDKTAQNDDSSTLNEFVKSLIIEQNIDDIIEKTLKTSSKEDFRMKGPLNPMIGFDCLNFEGPCRMFDCMCREDDEEDEWFKGNCEICKKAILSYRHSVRIPVIGGGFIGCFCSFECLYKTELPLGEDNDILIDEMEAILKSIGISP
jgi:hypothetical protein